MPIIIHFITRWILVGISVVLAISLSGNTPDDSFNQQVNVRMLTDHNPIAPGDSVRIGFLFDVTSPWHLYWINPGDTGMPTRVEWTLPEGVEVGSLQFPPPKRYSSAGMVDFTMEGDFLIWTTLTTRNSIKPGETLEVSALVSWLACNQLCVPGEKELSLKLKVESSANEKVASPDAGHFDRAIIQKLHRDSEQPQASIGNGNLWIRFPVSNLHRSDPIGAYFFPYEPLIPPSAPQILRKEDAYLILNTSVLPSYERDTSEFSGVLEVTFQDGTHESIQIDNLKLSDTSITSPAIGLKRILILILFAFSGGLILNLMPCVFPIIGLKIMGFASRAGDQRKKIALHGISFTLGVLLSFWILAAILHILRSSGHELGWGFQLQDPVFVFVLIVLFLIFGLSLSGVFEFGTSAISLANSRPAKSGLAESFASGILATIVATPCSAPFLAPALAAAITLPATQSWLLFTFIALGLSTPYLLLSLFPSALSNLPKPGQWMESFKQFMAYPLYATVAFLVWTLLPHLDASGQLNLFFCIPLLAMGTWIWGRWNRPHLSRRSRTLASLLASTVILAGLWTGFPRDKETIWQKWSPQAVQGALNNGNPVFVDFTARWCATCQVNKRVSLASEDVLQVFRDHDVVTLRADWTQRDPEITKELLRYGKAAVPVYLIYFPDNQKPVVLPEILTPKIILDQFNPPIN